MKLPKLGLIGVVMVIVVVGVLSIGLLSDVLVGMFYSPPEVSLIDLKAIGRSDGELLINATVKAMNTAGISVTLKSADVYVYYGSAVIGRGTYKGSIELPSGLPTKFSIEVYVNTSNPAFDALLEQLWLNESAIVTYKGKVYVEATAFWLHFGREVEVEGQIEIRLREFIKEIGWDVRFLEISGIGIESGNVYVPRHWIEDLIKTLYFLNEYLLASVLEARLQDWLAANGYS